MDDSRGAFFSRLPQPVKCKLVVAQSKMDKPNFQRPAGRRQKRLFWIRRGWVAFELMENSVGICAPPRDRVSMAKSSDQSSRRYVRAKLFACFLEVSNSLIVHSFLDLGNPPSSIRYSRFGIKFQYSLGGFYRLVVLVGREVLLLTGIL